MSQWYDLSRHGLSVWLDNPASPSKLVVRPILTPGEVHLLPDNLDTFAEQVSGQLVQTSDGQFQSLEIPITNNKLPADSWWSASFPASAKRDMASMCQFPVLVPDQDVYAQWAWRVEHVRPDTDLHHLKGAVAASVDLPLVVFTEEDAHRFANDPETDVQPISVMKQVTVLPAPAGQNVRWAVDGGQLMANPGLLDRLNRIESMDDRNLRHGVHQLAGRFGMAQVGPHAFEMRLGEDAPVITLAYAVDEERGLEASIAVQVGDNPEQMFASISAAEGKLTTLIDDYNTPKVPDDTLATLDPDTVNEMVAAVLHYQGAVRNADHDLYLLVDGRKPTWLRDHVQQSGSIEAMLMSRFRATQNQAHELLSAIRERSLTPDESANWFDYLESGALFAQMAKDAMEADGTSLEAYRALKEYEGAYAGRGLHPLENWTSLKSEVKAFGAKSHIEFVPLHKIDEPAFTIRYSNPSDGTAYPIVTEMYASGRAATSVNGQRVPGTGFTDEAEWQADAVRVALQMAHGLDVTGPYGNETAADDVDPESPGTTADAPEHAQGNADTEQNVSRQPEGDDWLTDEVRERLGEVRTLLVSRDDYPFADMTISEGIVMNASRPIMGDRMEQDGEFIHGRFYAAIPHDNEFADYNVKENAILHGVILYNVDEATLTQVALDNVAGKFASRFDDLTPDKKASQVRYWIFKLEGASFADVHAMVKAAKAKLASDTAVEPPLPAHSLQQLNADLAALNAGIEDPSFHSPMLSDDLQITAVDARTWEVGLAGVEGVVTIWHNTLSGLYECDGAGATGKAYQLAGAVSWADARIHEMRLLEKEADAAAATDTPDSASMANQDLRGMAFTITSETGEIKTQGTIPLALEGGSRLASFDYYRQLTHQHEGILWLTPLPDAPQVPKAGSTGDEPRMFGYTWHELQAMQKGTYQGARQIAQLPTNAQRVYSFKDGLINADTDALPARRQFKKLLDMVGRLLNEKPSHKVLDAVALRLNATKRKAGESLEARHARFTQLLNYLQRFQDYTADQFDAEFRKSELKAFCEDMGLKTSSSYRKKQYAIRMEAHLLELGVSFMDAKAKGAYKAKLIAKREAGEPIGIAEYGALVGAAGLRDAWCYTLGDVQVAQGLGLDSVVPKGERGEHSAAFDMAERYLQLDLEDGEHDIVDLMAEHGLPGTPEVGAFLERAFEIDNIEVVDDLLLNEFSPIAERLGFPPAGTFVSPLWFKRSRLQEVHDAALQASAESAEEVGASEGLDLDFDAHATSKDAPDAGAEDAGVRKDYGEFMPGARKHEYGSSFGWEENDLLNINHLLVAKEYTQQMSVKARELARKPKRDAIWTRPDAKTAKEQGVNVIAHALQRRVYQMIPPSTAKIVSGRGREARWTSPQNWIRLGAGYAGLVECLRDRVMTIKTLDDVREAMGHIALSHDHWKELKDALIPAYWHMSDTFGRFESSEEIEARIEEAKAAAAKLPVRDITGALPYTYAGRFPSSFNDLLKEVVTSAIEAAHADKPYKERYQAVSAFEDQVREAALELEGDAAIQAREAAIMAYIEEHFGSADAMFDLIYRQELSAEQATAGDEASSETSTDIELDSANDAAEELPTIHGIPSHKRPAPRFKKLKREGPDRRSGDITEEEFAQTFGFRGVEYGNWCNQAERTAMLNMAYDSFADMADGLGVPRRFMGFNGRLGIGLGSRGRGKAAAHFEPSTNVINLTKTVGAGALAHEWVHALDRELNRHANLVSGPYLTSAIENMISEDGVSSRMAQLVGDGSAHPFLKEMSNMMRTFVAGAGDPAQRVENFKLAAKTHIGVMQREMLKPADLKAIAETFAARTTNNIISERFPDGISYADRETQYDPIYKEQLAIGTRLAAEWHTLTAAYFQEAERRLTDNAGKDGGKTESIGALLFEGGRGKGYTFTREHAARQVVAHIPNAGPEHELFAADWVSKLGFKQFKRFYVKAPEAPRNADLSAFMESALALDGYKSSKKLYWSNAQELLARGLSAVIHDRMLEKGIRNDFASRYSGAQEFEGSEYLTSPNPEGAERELFSRAARPLIAKLQLWSQELVGEQVHTGMTDEIRQTIEEVFDDMNAGRLEGQRATDTLNSMLGDYEALPDAIQLMQARALDAMRAAKAEDAEPPVTALAERLVPVLTNMAKREGVTDFERLQDAVIEHGDPEGYYLFALVHAERADFERMANTLLRRIVEYPNDLSAGHHAAYLAARPEVPFEQRQALYEACAITYLTTDFLIERIQAGDSALPEDMVQRLENNACEHVALLSKIINLIKADIGVDVRRLVDAVLEYPGYKSNYEIAELAALPGVDATHIQHAMQAVKPGTRDEYAWSPYEAVVFAETMKEANKAFDVAGMRQWLSKVPYFDERKFAEFEELFPEAEEDQAVCLDSPQARAVPAL
jgi:hypothetical protein